MTVSAGLFRVRAVVWIVALLLAGSLSACSWNGSPNPDPRAYPGADSEVTLEKGLRDHRLKLPEAAEEVHFGAYIGREDSLDLNFDVACRSVSRFLAASGFTSALQADVVPSLVTSVSRAHGWDVERYKNPRGIEEDISGSVNRSVLVVDTSGGKCRVFVSSFL